MFLNSFKVIRGQRYNIIPSMLHFRGESESSRERKNPGAKVPVPHMASTWEKVP